MNVQVHVVLREVEGGIHVSLHDEDGEFLEAALPPDEETPDDGSGEEGGGEGGSGEDETPRLREALAKSQQENVALQAEVERLKQKVRVCGR